MKTYCSKFCLNTWVLITLFSVCIYEALSLSPWDASVKPYHPSHGLYLRGLTILSWACVCEALTHYPWPICVQSYNSFSLHLQKPVTMCIPLLGLYLWGFTRFSLVCIYGTLPVTLWHIPMKTSTSLLTWIYDALPVYLWPAFMRPCHCNLYLHLWNPTTLFFACICEA